MSVEPDNDYPQRPNRRRAMQAAISLGVVPLMSGLARSATLAFAPACFDVQADRALIWLCANEAARLHVRWGPAADALTHRSAERALDSSSDFTGHVGLQGLPSGETVYYRVFSGDAEASGLCRFNTPRKAGQNFSIAFSGDMQETYKPFRIFDVMAAAQPDYFVHLGDTVYADSPKRDFTPTHRHYRMKHARIRADRPLQAFLSQHANFVIWDDHEIENDAHGGLPQLPIAEAVFREYWPCASVETSGLYRAISLSPAVDLIIVDTRRFRSMQSMSDGPEKTMLGSQQKKWFLDTLMRSRATFKIVATSVPFHGGSQDAWGNYKTERDQIIAFLKAEKISNVVMISADYHFARDWSSKRTGIHEFMAGPLASFRAFERTPEIRERHSNGPHFAFGDDFNFGLIRYDATSNSLRVKYQDSGGKTLFETTITAA